jgi:hypothetical protein
MRLLLIKTKVKAAQIQIVTEYMYCKWTLFRSDEYIKTAVSDGCSEKPVKKVVTDTQ